MKKYTKLSSWKDCSNSIYVPYNGVTRHDVGWLATVLKRVKTLHLKNYFYIKMIDPKWISPYLTKNSSKVDISVNFRAVTIHPTLWRVTPLYGIALSTDSSCPFRFKLWYLTVYYQEPWSLMSNKADATSLAGREVINTFEAGMVPRVYRETNWRMSSELRHR